MPVAFLSDDQATRYLQQALEQRQETERVLNPDDVARLSPLLHEHVNMLGRIGLALFYVPTPVLPPYFIDRAMLLGKCMELMQLICRVLPSIFSRHPRVNGDSHNQK